MSFGVCARIKVFDFDDKIKQRLNHTHTVSLSVSLLTTPDNWPHYKNKPNPERSETPRFLLPPCVLFSFPLSFFRHTFPQRQSAWPDSKCRGGTWRNRERVGDRCGQRDWTSHSYATNSWHVNCTVMRVQSGFLCKDLYREMGGRQPCNTEDTEKFASL